MIARRFFLAGLGAALAAPAIVRAESLMKVVAPTQEILRPSFIIPATALSPIGIVMATQGDMVLISLGASNGSASMLKTSVTWPDWEWKRARGPVFVGDVVGYDPHRSGVRRFSA